MFNKFINFWISAVLVIDSATKFDCNEAYSSYGNPERCALDDLYFYIQDRQFFVGSNESYYFSAHNTHYVWSNNKTDYMAVNRLQQTYDFILPAGVNGAGTFNSTDKICDQCSDLEINPKSPLKLQPINGAYPTEFFHFDAPGDTIHLRTFTAYKDVDCAGQKIITGSIKASVVGQIANKNSFGVSLSGTANTLFYDYPNKDCGNAGDAKSLQL